MAWFGLNRRSALAAGTAAATALAVAAVWWISGGDDMRRGADPPAATPTGESPPASPAAEPGAGGFGSQSPTPSQAPAGPRGFPNASNTGPPAGRTLRTVSLGDTIRQNGVVLENFQTTGSFDVYANNVTIRNCRITTGGYWGIQLRNGYTNLTVENCEIRGNGRSQLQVAVKNISQGQITVRRNNIHTATDGFMGERGLIEDNYIHDLKEYPGDHVDGVQSNGSSAPGRLVIRHNTIINPVSQTSAIILSPVFGPIHDVTVERNLVAGGGYCVYGGKKHEGHPYSPRNVVFRDNVFSRRRFGSCGSYGPVAHFDNAAPGSVWTGNVWEGTGAAVRP